MAEIQSTYPLEAPTGVAPKSWRESNPTRAAIHNQLLKLKSKMRTLSKVYKEYQSATSSETAATSWWRYQILLGECGTMYNNIRWLESVQNEQRLQAGLPLYRPLQIYTEWWNM